MKASPATRPCVEFPCDNPELHANQGRATETTGAPPAVANGSPEHRQPVNEFDWEGTEYWVKELKRRWSLAKADAPEVNFPVLDAWGLEAAIGLDVAGTAWGDAESEPLGEALVLTESGVMLGELLVMPSETLFDEEHHALTASALGLELTERHIEHTGDDELARTDAADPFIEELLSLMPEQVNAEPELEFEPVDQSGEVRSVPDVQASKVAPAPAPTELSVVPRGVQPLVPLHLELTPTPAAISPWGELTAALSRHLLNGGHTRAAALIGPLLGGELVDFSRVEATAVERLVADGVAEVRGGRPLSTATFRQSARAFREEFATGGLNTSEALFWLSQLLVAITGGGDEEAFEAELRGLGVAQLLEWAA